jgi:hypothetical protein
MAKGSSHRSGARSRSKRRRQQEKWVPWIIGAAVLVIVVGVLWNQSWFAFASGEEPRDQEALFDITGNSYDSGQTLAAYPDPGQLGIGRQWLPALGADDAPVVVIEFSDIYCGHCRTYNLTSLEGILQDYVATGKVRYVDHYFGFATTVNEGLVDAMMCAAEQGRYFEFKHALFENVGTGSVNVNQAVRDAKLDSRAFGTCRRDGRYDAAVQESIFVNNMGVTGTPTFFVNGQEVVGNRPDEIRQRIDAELAALQ